MSYLAMVSPSGRLLFADLHAYASRKAHVTQNWELYWDGVQDLPAAMAQEG